MERSLGTTASLERVFCGEEVWGRNGVSGGRRRKVRGEGERSVQRRERVDVEEEQSEEEWSERVVKAYICVKKKE